VSEGVHYKGANYARGNPQITMTLLSDIREVLTEYSWPGQPNVGVTVPAGGFLLRPSRGCAFVAHAKAMKKATGDKYVLVVVKMYDLEGMGKSRYTAMYRLRCKTYDQFIDALDHVLPLEVSSVPYNETTFDVEHWDQTTLFEATPSPAHTDVSEEETRPLDIVGPIQGDSDA
jgi:hypothetical protein